MAGLAAAPLVEVAPVAPGKLLLVTSGKKYKRYPSGKQKNRQIWCDAVGEFYYYTQNRYYYHYQRRPQRKLVIAGKSSYKNKTAEDQCYQCEPEVKVI